MSIVGSWTFNQTFTNPPQTDPPFTILFNEDGSITVPTPPPGTTFLGIWSQVLAGVTLAIASFDSAPSEVPPSVVLYAGAVELNGSTMAGLLKAGIQSSTPTVTGGSWSATRNS